MARVRCFGQVIRKSDGKRKLKFTGKNLKNQFGYHSVLSRAEELVEEYDEQNYEIQIICTVEEEIGMKLERERRQNRG
jgi:putative aminopeptidase FrvX